MLLTCRTDKLASVVKILAKARQRILTEHFIIFEAQKDKLIVSNVNDIYGLRFFIEAQVEKEGKIMLPTKNLLAYFSNNDDEEVKIEREDAQMKFKSKHYKMNLNGYDDIPDFPDNKGNTFCHFTEEMLSDALKNTLFCVQKEQTNPILSGLYFSLQSIASTDSYRLSEFAINLFPGAEENKLILPSETALILKEVLKKKELKVKVTDNKIIFVNNEYE